MNALPAEKMAPISDPELRTLLLAYRRENWKGIQPAEIQEAIVEDLIHGDPESVLRQVRPYMELSNTSLILDVGSGVGSFVVACRRLGMRVFGVEPDKIGQGTKLNASQIARLWLSEPVFVSGIGEELPFPDASFDLVTMNQVVEHVTDQEKVIREAARVVRPGGVVYIACPNYLKFYESHYKINWLPLMPKSLGRLYLRLRGRSPGMLDQLTYTTNGRLRKLLAAVGPEFTALDLHWEQFLKKRDAGTFAARSTRLVSAITRLPLVGRIILWSALHYGSITEGGCEMLLVRKPQIIRESKVAA